MLEVAVSTKGTPAVTSTVVVTLPASSFKLISWTCETSRVKSAVAVLKASFLISTWYLPAGKALTTYSPESLVSAVTVRAVPVLVTVTAAWSMTAPLASLIVPNKRPVSVWPSARPARHRTRTRTRKNLLFIFPPNLGTSGDIFRARFSTRLGEKCKLYGKPASGGRFTRFLNGYCGKMLLLQWDTIPVTSVLNGCQTHSRRRAGTVLPTNR